MALRVTLPAFMEGIKAVKAAEGIENYDVNRDATRAEMRTYVCGQCHVEYYFKGEGKTLTYPWSKGLKAEDMLAYYDEIGFKDWTHRLRRGRELGWVSRRPGSHARPQPSSGLHSRRSALGPRGVDAARAVSHQPNQCSRRLSPRRA